MTWRNAYYIEQLMVLILPQQKIEMELSRRLVEAARALPGDAYTYYANEVKRQTDDPKGGHTDHERQSLLINLLSELQWAKEKQQVERSYGRAARLRATIVF